MAGVVDGGFDVFVRIVDEAEGGWAHITVDQIVFSDGDDNISPDVQLITEIQDFEGKLSPTKVAKLLWRLKVRHPRTARVPLMGVRQEYQHSRLGPTLAFMVIDAVRKALHQRGVRDVEMGWILEDNDGMCNIIETIGGEAYKTYRMYQKNL